MNYDVYSVQDYTYYVGMSPLDICEARARELSQENPGKAYFVVEANDNPVVMFRDGVRFCLSLTSQPEFVQS